MGAATGAIIGGAVTGNVRAASIGAAAGAAAWRVNRENCPGDQAAGMVCRRPAVILSRGGSGFYYSPYAGCSYDLRGVPPGVD